MDFLRGKHTEKSDREDALNEKIRDQGVRVDAQTKRHRASLEHASQVVRDVAEVRRLERLLSREEH